MWRAALDARLAMSSWSAVRVLDRLMAERWQEAGVTGRVSLPRCSPRRPVTQLRAGLPERKNGPELVFLRVGVAGFEPTASSSRTKRATKLRHTP